MFIQLFNWTIHVYKASQTGSERHKRWRTKAIKKRRCVVCSRKIQTKNPWTGEWYRMCTKHRLRANYLRNASNKK